MRSIRGFSLLEVLVAFALFALVGTALHGVFSGALRNAAEAEDLTRAVLIAQSRLATLGFVARLGPGTESGDVEGTKYLWVAEVRPYEPPRGSEANPTGALAAPETLLGAKLWEAEVTVSWPGPRATKQSVSLTTLRLVPVE